MGEGERQKKKKTCAEKITKNIWANCNKIIIRLIINVCRIQSDI